MRRKERRIRKDIRIHNRTEISEEVGGKGEAERRRGIRDKGKDSYGV